MKNFTSAPPWGRFTCLFTYVFVKYVRIHIHFGHFDLYHLSPFPHISLPLLDGQSLWGPCPTLECLIVSLWHCLVMAGHGFPES